MEYVVEGKVIKIFEIKTGVSKRGTEWQSMEFVVETQERFSHKFCLNLFGGDKISKAQMMEGDMVEVKFDVDSQEWNGKYYTKLNAYDVVNKSNPVQGTMLDAANVSSATAQPVKDDGMPF